MSDEILERARVAGEIAEVVTNYALADEPLADDLRRRAGWERFDSEDEVHRIYDDGDFWRVISQRTECFSDIIKIEGAAISEWVARVPGLYWQDGSAFRRRLRQDGIESRMGGWRTYSPPFKSRMVGGGVGTLKLPPADDGFRLVTLTMSLNASAGMPVLVSPDIWGYLKMSEGMLVSVLARWRAMPLRWAAQFPIAAGIPRGCLVLNNPSQVRRINDRPAPVMVHPFSVMEYWNGPVLLHDFVFATADTRHGEFRRDVEQFFEIYRKAQGRDGTYLLAADIAEPMWDASFGSPTDMRTAKGPQLRLIERRADEAINAGDCIEALLHKLSNVDTHVDLVRLSIKAGIPSQRWVTPGISLAEEAVYLVDAAVQLIKLRPLLEAVIVEFPN